MPSAASSTICSTMPRSGCRRSPAVRIIGTAREKAGVLSFVMDGVHPHDIGTILDQEGIAIRTGHHCAQPVMQRFGIPATARASFAFYNTKEEIDALVRGLRQSEGGVRLMSALRELYQEVILDHNKSPAEFPEDGDATRIGGGIQSPLRRPLYGLPEDGGGPDRGRQLRGRGCAISKARPR